MIRILHFIHGLNVGGAEAFIFNIIEASDSNKFRFGFALQNPDITNKHLLSLIKDRKIEIHFIPGFPFHLKSQYQELRRVILNNHYDVIHIHANSLVNPIPLMVSVRIDGLKTLIHSHNSSTKQGGLLGVLSLMLHNVNRRLFIGHGTKRLACSEKAAHWMFGNKEYSFMPNALNISNYTFTKKGRECVRQRYSIDKGDIVLGSIGRLVYAKNHKLMLDIFKIFNCRYPNSKLMIIGDGPLKESIIKYAVRLGVSKNVIFTGTQSATRDFYSCMDCFLLTSHYEGFPFTAIEAQANGLPIVASNNITKEIHISENVLFAPLPHKTRQDIALEDECSIWIEAISKLVPLRQLSESNLKDNPLFGSRFDIREQISDIENIYSTD